MSGAVVDGSGIVEGPTHARVAPVNGVLERTKRRLRRGLTLNVPEKGQAGTQNGSKEDSEVSTWVLGDILQESERRKGNSPQGQTYETSEGERRKYWTLVRPGRRRRQCEDVCWSVTDFRGPEGAPSSFYGLFDGHGGRNAAQYAADNLFPIFRNTKEYSNGRIEEALYEAFQQTDVKLRRDHASELGPCTGTTALTVYISERKLCVAHVGDSRAVLGSCHGVATCLSKDHTVERVDEHLRVEDKGGVILKKRVNGTLAVTRSIGDKDYKDYVIAAPEVNTRNIESSDDVLILASDGLWDVLTPEQAVRRAQSFGHDLEQACCKLIDDALAAGSMDDISVVVVSLRDPILRGRSKRISDVRRFGSAHVTEGTGKRQSAPTLSKLGSLQSASRHNLVQGDDDDKNRVNNLVRRLSGKWFGSPNDRAGLLRRVSSRSLKTLTPRLSKMNSERADRSDFGAVGSDRGEPS
mmetsp:Transcript_2955/g.9045  ORF Transcript_2955/g.9045 Transcript_2955/m.9045 type:complete len:467 (-) Transcript_2955:292-1692(-)